jgi:branched-chain amino acid transport system ATP-binding protein
VVLVEQSVNLALTLVERAVFLEKGEVRYDGPSAELLDRPDLVRSVFLEGAASVAVASVRNDSRTAKAPPREPTRSAALLSVEDVAVSFGGLRAVQGASFAVAAGQILGLIGANGAGKTTIFDVISGFVPADRGRILLGGDDITHLTPDNRARRGLGRSFQSARLFPSMTVVEAISVAHERHLTSRSAIAALLAAPSVRISEDRVTARVEELIESLHLQAYANKFLSELSTGTRRVVDLACALAHRPKVLLLDEPSAGIAQREAEALGPLLLDIRRRTDAALVVIEHDMPLLTAVADELVALDQGQVIASGSPERVLQDPIVVARYLGSTDEAVQRSGTRSTIRASKIDP